MKQKNGVKWRSRKANGNTLRVCCVVWLCRKQTAKSVRCSSFNQLQSLAAELQSDDGQCFYNDTTILGH